MNKKLEEEILNARLIPPAQSLSVTSEKIFTICDRCEILVVCSDETASEMVFQLAQEFWGITPKLSVCDMPTTSLEEAYKISVTETKIVLTSATKRGIRYAMNSLRQLAESDRGKLTSVGRFLLPCMEIEDAPDMEFRGIHLCFFPNPETTLVEIERQIRLAAYLKYNYVVIEPWGTLQFPSHPDFCFQGHSFDAGEFRRLVRLAKSLGITPIPQFNIFGHASAARAITGKHALLDFHPEYAPLFEPDGWCWCLSNKETRSFLTDLVTDLLDIFESPPYFHIGCDEADAAQSCIECRRANFTELLRDHLFYFGDLLKKRNTRPMLWHDMFVSRSDPKFNGYVHNGTDETIAVLEELSKDFIICDWRYDFTEEDFKTGKPTWATLHHFLDRGFDTIGCPWLQIPNTVAFGKAIKENKGMGLLMTCWHRRRGYYLFQEFAYGAWNSWSPDSEAPNTLRGSFLGAFNACVRQVNRDMGVTTYQDIGTSPYQVTGDFYEG